jgi:hypothetical protein
MIVISQKVLTLVAEQPSGACLDLIEEPGGSRRRRYRTQPEANAFRLMGLNHFPRTSE